MEQSSVDPVASRAVFEHLKNLNEVLQSAWTVLGDGSAGVIEVPSFDNAINERRYYDVFSVHLGYCTKHSLIGHLGLNGFEIVKLFNEFDGKYIAAYFRKIANTDY